jgi:transcriptional regulator with XRE-family HTH domain
MKDIGILLKEARESKGLEIEEAARELKIRPYYLEILESGDISSVSSEIYIVGYLKTYAKWLGISSNEIVLRLKSENTPLFSGKQNVNAGDVSSPLFVFDIEIFRTNGMLTILAFFMAIITYTFWYQNNNILVTPTFDLNIESDTISRNKNWTEDLFKHGKKFLLIAKDTITLRTKENGGPLTSQKLDAGDIYFFSSDKDSVLETDNPDHIDVFYDNDTDSGTFVGTLSSIPTLPIPESTTETPPVETSPDTKSQQ